MAKLNNLHADVVSQFYIGIAPILTYFLLQLRLLRCKCTSWMLFRLSFVGYLQT